MNELVGDLPLASKKIRSRSHLFHNVWDGRRTSWYWEVELPDGMVTFHSLVGEKSLNEIIQLVRIVEGMLARAEPHLVGTQRNDDKMVEALQKWKNEESTDNSCRHPNINKKSPQTFETLHRLSIRTATTLTASSLALLESNNLESKRSTSPAKKFRTLASTGIGCLWTSTLIADTVGSSSLDGLKRFGEGIALGALSGVDMVGWLSGRNDQKWDVGNVGCPSTNIHSLVPVSVEPLPFPVSTPTLPHKTATPTR
jgi:hypothetical protein